MHNGCCACAYQLLCKRTTAVVRPKILTVSTTYPISSNNISYLFQQHILSLPTTYPISSNNISYLFQQHILSLSTTYPISSNNKKRVNHKLMTHPLLIYYYIYNRSSDSLSFVQNRINFFCYQFRRDMLHTCEVSPSARLVTIDTARAAR